MSGEPRPTDSKAIPTPTRRALLVGTAGGVAAAVAATLAQALPAAAGSGTVTLGGANHSDSLTTITSSTGSAFRGTGANAGVGVRGDTAKAYGVYGSAGGTGIGTAGVSVSTTNPAVLGRSTGNNTGVLGYSGPSAQQPAGLANTGVYGYAAQNSGSRGVTGETTTGRGVNGIATTGVAGFFKADAAGTALQVSGRVKFSTSGVSAYGVGSAVTTIAPGSDIGVATTILCTLQSNQPGLFVERTSMDIAANTFTVFLSAALASGKSASVHYLVIG